MTAPRGRTGWCSPSPLTARAAHDPLTGRSQHGVEGRTGGRDRIRAKLGDASRKAVCAEDDAREAGDA